jgi:hypothetical protein
MAPRVLARREVTADAPEEKQMHGLRKQRRGVHRELTCQKKKGGGGGGFLIPTSTWAERGTRRGSILHLSRQALQETSRGRFRVCAVTAVRGAKRGKRNEKAHLQ